MESTHTTNFTYINGCLYKYTQSPNWVFERLNMVFLHSIFIHTAGLAKIRENYNELSTHRMNGHFSGKVPSDALLSFLMQKKHFLNRQLLTIHHLGDMSRWFLGTCESTTIDSKVNPCSVHLLSFLSAHLLPVFFITIWGRPH